MAFQEVVNYQLNWLLNESKGATNLINAQSEVVTIETENPLLYNIWVDMLSNEKPVFFDMQTATLRTGAEPIGETEK